MEPIHLFNGEVRNPNASNYGAFYWGVVLEDGRNIFIHADKMVVTDTGDLIAVSTSRSKDGMRTDRNPQPMLALAKTHWVAYFAASLIDGEPVALDNSVKFPSK